MREPDIGRIETGPNRNAFCIRISGERACFTRPELKCERMSYEIITPSAVRGLCKAVYWKPAIEWYVDRIEVLNEIRYANVRKNEVKSKVSPHSIRRAMTEEAPLQLEAASDRTQRNTCYLRDVDYLAWVHFTVLSDAPSETYGKHYAIMHDRLSRGRCFQQPYLGLREFPADVQLVEDEASVPASFYAGRPPIHLGPVLLYLHYPDAKTVLGEYFDCTLRDGTVEVPASGMRG